MAIDGKVLATVDVLECFLKDRRTGEIIPQGNTTKTGFSNKVDKIEILDGISMKKRCTLKTKKVTDITYTLSTSDFEIMARQAGTSLNKTTTGTFKWQEPVTVATGAATITGATRIIAIYDQEMAPMKIINTTPATNGEVKVAGTSLTFNTGYLGTKVYVTYQSDKATEKGNLTIEFNAESFAKSYEYVGHSIAYDTETENVVADVYVDYYDCSLDDDYTWNFEGGKSSETEVKLSVNTPKLLPDGTANIKSKQGEMVVTER